MEWIPFQRRPCLPSLRLKNGQSRDETLKQAKGWYEVGGASKSLFEWDTYGLYEDMMQPYATRRARDLPLSSLAATLVPYASWAIEISGDVATNLDPVWQHTRRLSSMERDALLGVDGSKSMLQIAEDLSLPLDVFTATLYSLYLDGLILFDQSDF